MTVIAFHKPFRVVTQFRPHRTRPSLADFITLPDVYPAGRLDAESEGLLLLTDDGRLQARITEPKHKLAKVYWVQVEGIPDETALARLRQGVRLREGRTRPARVVIMDPPPLPPRDPPVRHRATVPTSWLSVTLREGRNRQIRRMTAAVGHPTLRLVRCAVGPVTLDGLEPGRWRRLTEDEIAALAPVRGAGPPRSRPPRPRRRRDKPRARS